MITEADVLSVSPEAWVDTCASLAARGASVVDWLTAIDREVGIDVLVCLVNPGTAECAVVSCRLEGEHPSIASLGAMFPGADWHERETAEMFGVEFAGRESTENLLLKEPSQTPLRKSAPLEARVETPWPGSDGNGGRRRRKLPPGVRQEWIDDRE